MQTLHEELDSPEQDLTDSDHPVLQGLMADPAVAYAEEVRVLRQRVAMLEAELAATKVAVTEPARARQLPPITSIDFAPVKPEATPSEFVDHAAPAVTAASNSVAATPEAAEPVQGAPVHSAPVSDPGFAEAWSAEEAASTFEERVAERAFFQASTIDEESRSWLLAK